MVRKAPPGPVNALNDKHKRRAWALNRRRVLSRASSDWDLYLNLIWNVQMVSAV